MCPYFLPLTDTADYHDYLQDRNIKKKALIKRKRWKVKEQVLGQRTRKMEG